jgi:formate hydrogenlyase subunit 3/multisubunit Na+/H+ antiporter MnhD subunit
MLLSVNRFLVRYGPLGRPSWANSNAAKKAFVTNRIGDFGFLMAAFLMFWSFGSLNFGKVFAQAPLLAQAMPGLVIAVTLFMLLRVSGKSAQIPLYLVARCHGQPDACLRADPCATMVTAGVYLISRSAPLYVTHVGRAVYRGPARRNHGDLCKNSDLQLPIRRDWIQVAG